MLKKSLVAACAITLGTFSLTACGSSGSGGSGDSGDSGDDAITMGFAQVGAESGWRTANTKSIQEAAADGRDRPEVLRRAAEAGEPDQGDPLLHPAEGRRHRVQPGRRDRLGHRAAEAKGANIPVILTDRAVDSQDDVALPDLPRLGLRRRGQEGRRVAGRQAEADGNGDGKVNIVELQGTTGAAPGDRPQARASPTASRPTRTIKVIASQTGDFTRAGGKKVMEAFLKSQPDIDVVFAHNDDMGLGAIEAIEAAGKKPGKDIKIITVDAVKDGMPALADGKINFIVECNPLLGPQLMDLAKKVVAGEEVPSAVVTEETTFNQEQAKEALPDRAVLTEQVRRSSEGSVAARPDRGTRRGPASPRQGTGRSTPMTPPSRAGTADGARTGRRPVVEMRDITHRVPRGQGAGAASTSACSRARCTP